MKSLRTILIITFLATLYPFGCEAQINCDPLESERYEAQIQAFEITVADLTEQNEALTAQGVSLQSEINGLKIIESNLLRDKSQLTEQNAGLESTVNGLQTQNKDLSELLAECRSSTPERDTIVVQSEYITVGGVEYKVSDIELIRPKLGIDTVTVTHCGATKETDWWHHGGISEPYPKDITFATTEFGMTRVHFKDSVTNEIKVQASYKLKRMKDYVNARTTYEFVE